MKPARSLLLLTLCLGCASPGGSQAKLTRARDVLRAVEPGWPCADPAVADAKQALEYADFEERERPGDPLAAERAQLALDKALRARAICGKGLAR